MFLFPEGFGFKRYWLQILKLNSFVLINCIWICCVPQDFGTVVIVLHGVFDEAEAVHITDEGVAVSSEQVKSTHCLLKITQRCQPQCVEEIILKYFRQTTYKQKLRAFSNFLIGKRHFEHRESIKISLHSINIIKSCRVQRIFYWFSVTNASVIFIWSFLNSRSHP